MDDWAEWRIDETDAALQELSLLRVPSTIAPRQVAFLHIMKTAGTSVHAYLRELMPGVPVFHGHEMLFDAVAPKKLASYGLVLGHFSFGHLAKMRDPFVITFLRDPVERVLSFYSHLYATPKEHGASAEVAAISGLPFSKFVRSDEPVICQYLDNQQSYALVSDWRADRNIPKRELCSRAVENLQRIDFVGRSETFDASLTDLAEKLGVAPPENFPRKNAATTRIRQSDISWRDLAILRSRNAVDAQLYRSAFGDGSTVAGWRRWFTSFGPRQEVLRGRGSREGPTAECRLGAPSMNEELERVAGVIGTFGMRQP